MHMRSAVHALAPVTLLVSLALLTLWGCTGSSPGNDPAIRRQFEMLSDAISDIQADAADLQDLVADLEERLDEIEQRPSGGAGNPAEIAQLRSTNRELQQQISDLEDQVNALAQARASAGSERVTVAEMAGQPVPNPEEDRPTVAVDAAPEDSAPARQRGFYHTLGANETLEEVAQRHNIRLSELLEANGLPPNVNFPPGQDIFIPQP